MGNALLTVHAITADETFGLRISGPDCTGMDVIKLAEFRIAADEIEKLAKMVGLEVKNDE
jgi:hypothetical protein